MENEKNLIAGNVIVQIIGRIIVLIMSLITIKLISNYAGTEGTGYYNTIITYLTFFITIADFGLFSIGVREATKHPEKNKQLINNIFVIRLISAAVVTTISVVIAQFTNYPEIIKTGVLVASIFLFFNLFGSVFDMIFQIKMEMKKVAYAEIIAKIISLVALFVIIGLKLNFFWIIGTVSLSSTISIIIKYFLTSRADVPELKYEKAVADSIIRLALPFGMIFILNNFYFKVDTLILFYFKGASEVGIYAIAYRVLETTLFAAAYLSYSLKPLLSATINSDKQKAGRAASNGLIFLLSMSLIISVVCIPFSKQIITFLSNQDFLAGAPIIIVLAFASIFIYLNTLVSEILIASDSRRYLLGMSVSVLLFNLIANIIFIPIYSFYAAGVITLISEILIFSLGFSKITTIVPIKINFSMIVRLIFSAVFAIICSLALNLTGIYFIVSMVAGVIIYLLVAYFINAIPKEMIKNYLLSLKTNG